MTPEHLAAIRERAENATPGPWWTTRDVRPPCVYAGDGSAADLAVAETFELPDAEFIAGAREWIPALLDHVDEVNDAASSFAQALSSVTADNVRLGDILQAIYELHILYTDIRELQWCYHCETPWPCPTRRALDGD